jgi:Raf kinase inhibitor-like YbhB/YbcL family protein
LNRPATYLSGIVLALLLVGCSYLDQLRGLPATEEAKGMAIQLTSTAFAEDKPIPVVHTCEGDDVSPPLSWSNVPAGTKSLALIGDDPDAPGRTWVHWVVYGIPPNVSELPQAVPTTETLSNGAQQGTTDFGRVGYGGPCPPKGKPHRYFFKLYALDSELPLKTRATKQDILNAMKGHILAEGQLMGTYQRK